MAALNQSLSVNGQKLSNNDPDLVITLDDHPVVQISKIEEERITYSFSGDVDQETTYNLNLTFTYKATHQLVIPMTFIHKVAKPNLVMTDVPLTVQMWQTGSTPPFKVELNGTDITANIQALTLGDSDYIKADSATADAKVWEVLYADPAATDTEVPFSFQYTKGGVDWDYQSSGTFKLPAWDGVALSVNPFSANDPLFSNIRVKINQSVTVPLVFTFKGNNEYSKTNVGRATDHDDLQDGAVDIIDNDGDATEGRAIAVKGLKIGTVTPKIAFNQVTPLGGYPENTEKLTLNYWQPEVEVWDDVLTVSPDTQPAEVNEGGTVEVPLTFTWADGNENIPVNDADLALVITPEGKADITATSPTSITLSPTVDVTEDTVENLTVTATYEGKTATSDIDLTIKYVAPPETLTLESETASVSGQQGEKVTIPVVLKHNNTVLSLKDPGVTVTLSDTTIATIDPDTTTDDVIGIVFVKEVTADESGMFTLTVSYNGKEATLDVDYTVVKPDSLTFELTGESVTGRTGDLVTEAAQLLYNGEAVDLNAEGVTITSSDPSIIAIDPATTTATVIGLSFVKSVTEEETGTVNITVDYNTLTATDTLTYTLQKPESLSFIVDPNAVSGLKGDVVTLDAILVHDDNNVDLTADGVALALADNDVIELVSANTTANEVQVRFIKDVAEDETLDVILTASYVNLSAEDTLSVTMKAVTVTASDISPATLEQAKTNTITLTLKNSKGEPVVGLADRAHTLTWSVTPDNADVSPGQGSELIAVAGEDGVYTTTVDVGHKGGVIALTHLTVDYADGVTVEVGDLPNFTTSNVPVTATAEPTSIAADGDTPVKITVKQKRFPDQTETLVPGLLLTNVDISGNVVVKTVPSVTGDGIIDLVLTGNGVEGTVSINATLSDASGYLADLDVDQVVNAPFVLTVVPEIQDITTDEQTEFNVPLAYQWSDGDVALTPRQVALTFSPDNVVTLTSRSDDHVTLKSVEDVSEQQLQTVTITATYNGKTVDSWVNLTIDPVIPDSLSMTLEEDTAAGAINDEVVLTPNLKFNDTVVELTDPGVVITVSPAEVAQLESGDTTATTLSFLVAKPVSETETNTVTVTATYNGLTATDTLELTVNPEVINVELVSPDMLTQAQANPVTLKLTNKDGQPFENAVLSSISWKSTPSDPAVLPGWSNMLAAVDGEPGVYLTNVNAGHRAGKIELDTLIITSHNVPVTVQGSVSWNTVDTPLIVTQDITDISADNTEPTTVTVTVKQKRHVTGDTLIPGITLSGASITGEGSLVEAPVATPPGVFTFKVLGNGEAGAILFTATVSDDSGRALDQITVGLTTTKDPVLTVSPATQDKSTREDQTVEIPLTYTWTDGETNVPVDSADLSFDVTPLNTVTVDSKTATALILKPVADTGDDTVHPLTITATYQGKSVGTAVNLTITSLPKPTLENVQSPLTMNLWDTTPLSFKVMFNGNDITSSVTGVEPTNQADINDKFEFVTISETSWGYKSVLSSTTEQITAQANFNVKVTTDGKDYVLPGTVQLITNVNNGSIPTNRFDTEME